MFSFFTTNNIFLQMPWGMGNGDLGNRKYIHNSPCEFRKINFIFKASTYI